MKVTSLFECPFFRSNLPTGAAALAIATLLFVASAVAQIEGFTEPFRKIDLSSDETGAIDELFVDEGHFIEKDGIVCKLDTSVQKIQVEIAKHQAEADSQIQAVEQSYNKRIEINNRIKKLRGTGHATDSEVMRSEMELSIAKARFFSAKEEAAVRDIEYRRALLQLERRTVRVPFAGVIAKVHRREGEFVSPLHPEIVMLVRLDRLIAKFNVPSSQINTFVPGGEYEVELANGQTVSAKVYSVGVQTDAQSLTVEVKLVIENPENKIRAGEMLTLNI